jgi:myosin heavy subunit
LEKSRIVNQANDERNYHTFHQFCTAGDVDLTLKNYNINDASQYYYLSQNEIQLTTNKNGWQR